MQLAIERDAVVRVLQRNWVTILMSPDVIERAIVEGRKRQDGHADHHKDALRLRPDHPSFEHELGLIGEEALNQYDPRFLVDYRRLPGGDAGKDCTINGYTIGIKTRSQLWHDLIVRRHQATADFYVLILHEPGSPHAHLCGFCTRARLLEEQPQKAFNAKLARRGYSNNLVLCPSQLTPIHALRDAVGINSN